MKFQWLKCSSLHSIVDAAQGPQNSHRTRSHGQEIDLLLALPIVFETLGLMDELVDLSTSDKPLKPEKLHDLNGSMMEEIDRANQIIRNMNTFAHYVDAFVGRVDVGQLVELMIYLCQLDAAARRTRFQVDVPEQVSIQTSPFFLADLIHKVLNDALKGASKNRDISVSISEGQDRVEIAFSGMAEEVFDAFPSTIETALAGILSATVKGYSDRRTAEIILPICIERGRLHQLDVDS